MMDSSSHTATELHDAAWTIDGGASRLVSVRAGSIAVATSAETPAEPWMPLSAVCAVEFIDTPRCRGRALRLHCLKADPAGLASPTYEAHELRAASAGSNSEAADNPEAWAQGLRQAIKVVNGDQEQRAPVLVLINPFSGKRKGQLVWTTRCAPVFQAAGLRYEVIITREAGEAKRVAAEVPLGQYSCIACVGGDGILCEVTNGIMSRPDWEQATTGAMLPVAPIPSGTANATTHTLYRSPEPAAAVCHILRNNVRRVDMFLASQPSLRHYVWGVLSVNCGIVSDVDFGSERIRFMGNLRTSIWAVMKIIGQRTYRCRVSYLPTDTPRQAWWGHPCTGASCQHCNGQAQQQARDDIIRDDQASSDEESEAPSGEPVVQEEQDIQTEQPFESEEDQTPVQEMTEAERATCTKSLTVGEEWIGSTGIPAQYGRLFAPEVKSRQGWVTREMTHTFIGFQNQAWIDPALQVAPFCHVNDGCMDICMLPAEYSYRSKMIKLFSALQTGAHIAFEHLEYHKVRAFTLESQDEYEFFGIDGERVPHAPLNVYVAHGLLPVLCTL